MFKSNGNVTSDPLISYKWRRLASTASERKDAKYHWKMEFLMIYLKKRGCQGGWGQGNHMYFLHFEVKEAVEVKMNDGAIEATEVVRFS